MKKILSLKDVSKIFYTKTQQTTAIEDLTFDVDFGEFLAIIGPSGCGKTTILSLISSLIMPTSGTVTTNSDKAVGYMLQQDHLFEWRTIYDNILLGLEIKHQLTEANKKYVDMLLDKYGLTDFKHHYPKQLSGGMRQRVALIRTLATSPDILLLDEPFSALDFQTRLRVCDDIYNIIKSEGKTSILVTHDISEAIAMADRVIVLSKRPCKVLTIHDTNLSDIATPLKRRESNSFGKQFEKLNDLLNGGQHESP